MGEDLGMQKLKLDMRSFLQPLLKTKRVSHIPYPFNASQPEYTLYRNEKPV
jgi:hypothetical protein|tara:strand:+ start:309 stop:461 length:153 start_codon:yes stop_codon:yes gene_type:complete